MLQTCLLIVTAGLLCGGLSASADGGERLPDLTEAGAAEWLPADAGRWHFEDGSIHGRTPVFDGAKTDPQASAFLESRRLFAGDKTVEVDLIFDQGRYFGIYFDYDPETESGIWMATGHPLPAGDKIHNAEAAYIKTVDDGHWVVRATGELDVTSGVPLTLRFERSGDDYRIWQGERLVVTYRKPGGYPAGKLRLRLVNSAARIDRLSVTAEVITAEAIDGP